MRTSFIPPKNRKYFHTKKKMGRYEMYSLKRKKEDIDKRKSENLQKCNYKIKKKRVI